MDTPTDPSGSGGLVLTITGAQVWDKLTNIERAVNGLPSQVADHEIRLRALEKRIYLAAGFAAALGGGVGGIIAQIYGG